MFSRKPSRHEGQGELEQQIENRTGKAVKEELFANAANSPGKMNTINFPSHDYETYKICYWDPSRHRKQFKEIDFGVYSLLFNRDIRRFASFTREL